MSTIEAVEQELRALRSASDRDENAVDTLLEKLASLQEAAGNFDAAQQTMRELLQRVASRVGVVDPKTLRLLYSTASLSLRAGQYDQAEALLGQLMALRQQVYGTIDADMMDIVDKLAAVYTKRGMLEAAQQVREKYLATLIDELRTNHGFAVEKVKSVVANWNEYVHLNELERLWEQCHQHLRTVSGVDAEETLTALLQVCIQKLRFSRQSEAAQTERNLRHILEKRRAQYGEDHPEVFKVMHRLAALYTAEGGRYSEAASLFAACHAMSCAQSPEGSQLLEYLDMMHAEARMRVLLGDRQGSCDLYQQEYEQRIAHQGQRHPKTLDALYDYADAAEIDSNINVPLQLHKDGLLHCEAVYGLEHPITLHVLYQYVIYMFRMRGFLDGDMLDTFNEELPTRHALVLSQYNQIWPQLVSRYGEAHPFTLVAAHHISQLYIHANDMGKVGASAEKRKTGRVIPPELPPAEEERNFTNAIFYMRQSLRFCFRALGRNHMNTMIVLTELADLYIRRDNSYKNRHIHLSVQLLEEAMKVSERVYAIQENDPDVAEKELQREEALAGFRSRLATAYFLQLEFNRYKQQEAEAGRPIPPVQDDLQDLQLTASTAEVSKTEQLTRVKDLLVTSMVAHLSRQRRVRPADPVVQWDKTTQGLDVLFPLIKPGENIAETVGVLDLFHKIGLVLDQLEEPDLAAVSLMHGLRVLDLAVFEATGESLDESPEMLEAWRFAMESEFVHNMHKRGLALFKLIIDDNTLTGHEDLYVRCTNCCVRGLHFMITSPTYQRRLSCAELVWYIGLVQLWLDLVDRGRLKLPDSSDFKHHPDLRLAVVLQVFFSDCQALANAIAAAPALATDESNNPLLASGSSSTVEAEPTRETASGEAVQLLKERIIHCLDQADEISALREERWRRCREGLVSRPRRSVRAVDAVCTPDGASRAPPDLVDNDAELPTKLQPFLTAMASTLKGRI